MLLLAGAVTAPHTLRAQQKAMPVVGVLGSASPGPFAPLVAAVRQGGTPGTSPARAASIGLPEQTASPRADVIELNPQLAYNPPWRG